ncbi:MAG: ECF-type sigma factor [Bryobacteraceae bacterium]
MPPGEITQLLQRVAQGDKDAEADLIPQVYNELRKLAAGFLRSERPGHTLQATALVHEAWLRLSGNQEIEWNSRAHFFAIAARMMRRILVDYARQKKAGKRGGSAPPLSLDGGLPISDAQCSMVADLDEALQRLHALNQRLAGDAGRAAFYDFL